jgi:hypothetical protein
MRSSTNSAVPRESTISNEESPELTRRLQACMNLRTSPPKLLAGPTGGALSAAEMGTAAAYAGLQCGAITSAATGSGNAPNSSGENRTRIRGSGLPPTGQDLWSWDLLERTESEALRL